LKPELDVRQRDYVRREGTMQFVIHCHDKPDAAARQSLLRDAHLRYLEDQKDRIVARGPLLDDDGVKTIGRVMILDVRDKEEVVAFWENEPFSRAGVYDWTMERWRFGHV